MSVIWETGSEIWVSQPYNLVPKKTWKFWTVLVNFPARLQSPLGWAYLHLRSFWDENVKFAKNSVQIRFYLMGLWDHTTRKFYKLCTVLSMWRNRLIWKHPLKLYSPKTSSWISLFCDFFANNSRRNKISSVGKVRWKLSTLRTQESSAVADKPARRLRKVCTVYVRAVGL